MEGSNDGLRALEQSLPTHLKKIIQGAGKGFAASAGNKEPCYIVSVIFFNPFPEERKTNPA